MCAQSFRYNNLSVTTKILTLYKSELRTLECKVTHCLVHNEN